MELMTSLLKCLRLDGFICIYFVALELIGIFVIYKLCYLPILLSLKHLDMGNSFVSDN